MTWAVGQRLQAGKYTIEAVLGEGGFGITFLARDAVWNPVVIKTLNDTVQYHPRFEQLEQDFVNEALWLAKCTHPHIVQVHRVFQEGGQWCMVMEYIAGENLAHRVKSRGVLSEPEALWYIRQIGEALMLMHQNGLLHRDVKPENIMVRAEKPEAVLLDLGIAREFIPDSMQNHTAIISNGYAPIEQYEYQAKRGAFSDVYGLAATLYTLLTGTTPTDATIRAFNLQRHGHDPVEPANQVNPQVSERTNQAIIAGMAIEWQDRPQTIEAWLNLLPTTVSPAPIPAVEMGNGTPTNGTSANGISVTGTSATMPPPASSIPYTAMQPQSAMVTLPLSASHPEEVVPKPPLQINPPTFSGPKSLLAWIGLGLGLAGLMAVTGFGVSRWLLDQRAEAKLAQLKQLDAAGDYQACLAKAETISSNQPVYEEAQAFMNACAAGLIDQAKELAENSQYQEALQAVVQIPPDSRVGEEAQDLANQWSEQVRQQAEKLYAEQGKLNEAIALLRSIPSTTEVGQTVEETLAEWQKAWAQNEKVLQEAKQALETEDWQAAADKANTLTTPYWQTQANDLRQEAEAQIAAAEEAQRQQEAAAEEERQKQQEVAFSEAHDRCLAGDGEDWRSACQEYEQLCEAQGGSFVADAGYVGCHTGAEEDKLPPQPAKPPKIEGLPPESGSSSNPNPNDPIEAPPPPMIPRLDR